MTSILFTWLNMVHTSPPKRYPAPRGERPQPSTSSGSDHSRSHIGPSCGTSCFRSMYRTSSMLRIAGDRPPWTQKILLSMSTLRLRGGDARGRARTGQRAGEEGRAGARGAPAGPARTHLR